MQRPTRPAASGFTLVETLIASGMLVVLAVILIGMYVNYTSFYRNQGASLEMVNDAATLANHIHLSAVQATAILDSHSFSGTLYTSSSTALVLQLPTVNSSGNVVSNTYDYIVYYATSTAAYEQTDASAGSARVSGSRRLSNTVLSLSFTYESTPSNSGWVEMDLKTKTATSSGSFATSTHITERSYLRN